TVNRTTLRANVTTLGAIILLAFGHWLPWMTCCIPFMMTSGSGEGLQHVAKFQTFALTPPVTLGWLAFYGEEFRTVNGGWDSSVELMVDAVLGLMMWGIAAFVLWSKTSERFRKETGRQPIRIRSQSLRDQGETDPS